MRAASIRSVLLAVVLLVGGLATATVATVGAFAIRNRVVGEAQARVNHDLDLIASLYDDGLRTTAERLRQRCEGWSDIAPEALEAYLRRTADDLRFVVLSACDVEGRPLAGSYAERSAPVPVRSDPILRRALTGVPAWGTAVLPPERLEAEGGKALRNAAAVVCADGALATEAGLFQWFAVPLKDAAGRVAAVVYGGRMLNHDHALVDSLRDIVFGGNTLYEGKPFGAVTVFLGGTRVATNVLDARRRRAVGTEVSEQVRREVLERGRRWQARAWVVDAWYLSGYEPLRDAEGSVVGMLYVGLLEAPYRRMTADLLTKFLLPAGAILLCGAAATWLVVLCITRPLRDLQRAAERLTQADWDAPPPESRAAYAEIRDLAGALRRMQEAIAQRDRDLRRRNDELAEANDRLRQTNQNYMKTLGFITHELRSPLAAIQGLIDVLLLDLYGGLPDKARHALVRIKRNCEELQDMVKNYLDLARAERGELVAAKARMDLRKDVVEPAVTQCQPLFESRRMRLAVECPEGLALEADPELLRIALSNYLSNAAKYGREGGEARVEAASLEGQVVVSVWNEGPGFAPEEGEALFEKFSRLRNEHTRDKRGSGLGLYICREILAQHGGTVWAESEPGRWARFSFRLPALPPSAP